MTRDLLGQVRNTLAGNAVRDRGSSGASPPGPTSAQVAAALPVETRLLGDAAARSRIDELRREIAGAGPLEPLLAIPEVTDVLVHGPSEVYIDRGGGLEQVNIRFPDDAAVRRLAQRLASAAGRRLDDAIPYVDARMPGGIRLHAVLAPVSARGTSISLRVPARRAFGLDELVSAGSLSPDGAEILRRIVGVRRAFLITGGAGSGKTTLLATMLSLVSPAERIVIVEDARELAPDHPRVVQLEARPPNLEGAGEITVRALVRQALRMRPDRLVVGEVRSGEVVDLLAALNTGHDGGCGTLHANAADDVPARIEALGVAGGLDRLAVHSQLAAAVDLIIQVRRGPDGRRRLSEIACLERTPSGLVVARIAASFDEHGSLREAAGMLHLRALLGVSVQSAPAGEPTALAEPAVPLPEPRERAARPPCGGGFL